MPSNITRRSGNASPPPSPTTTTAVRRPPSSELQAMASPAPKPQKTAQELIKDQANAAKMNRLTARPQVKANPFSLSSSPPASSSVARSPPPATSRSPLPSTSSSRSFVYDGLTQAEKASELSVKANAQALHNKKPLETGTQEYDIGHGPVTASVGRPGESAYVAKTKKENYGGQSVGDSYADMVNAVPQSKATDQEIAAAVLNPDKMKNLSPLAKNIVAKMAFCGNVSEAQRQPDADKIFRGAMRAVRDGQLSLADVFIGPDAVFSAANTADDMRHALGAKMKSKSSSNAAVAVELGGYLSE